MIGTPRREWTDDDPTRIPYWIYSDEEVYRREQEVIFNGPFWFFVALTCEISAPGDFKRATIGERPVIVVRTRTGEVAVLENRCTHRGAALCQQEYGRTTKFLCPYHAWSFALDGSLIGVPFRRPSGRNFGMPEDFDIADHGLKRLAVAERNGAIFASFGNPPPFEQYLGPKMIRYFDRLFNGRELVVLGYHRQRIQANWKLMYENIKDPYHASLLHVFFATFGLVRPDQANRTEMDDTGMHSVLVHQKAERLQENMVPEVAAQKGSFSLKDPRIVDLIKEFPGSETTVMQTIWPNLIVQQSVNGLGVRYMLPRGPHCFDFLWTAFGYADDTPEMRAHRLRQANLFGPAGLVAVDDGEVMEFLQQGLSRYPESTVVAQMGGRETADTNFLMTEAPLRKYIKFYREVMAL